MKLQSVQLSANTTGSQRLIEDLPTIEAGPHRMSRAPTFGPRRGYVTTPRQEREFFPSLESVVLIDSVPFRSEVSLNRHITRKIRLVISLASHGKKSKYDPNPERENVPRWTIRPQSLSPYAFELSTAEIILGASKNPHNAGEMLQLFRDS